MRAKVEFDRAALMKMPVTMEFTATFHDWTVLLTQVEKAEQRAKSEDESYDPITPLGHCIKNLIKAVEENTGHGYSARGYSYDYTDEKADEDV